MKILGLSITRESAAPAPSLEPDVLKDLPILSGVDNRGGWYPVVREPSPGAWQRNQEYSRETVLAFGAVYSCIVLIATDISKCRMRLVEMDKHGIWSETSNPAFSPVLRKPNHFQNRIQFFESWVVSKLVHGNSYVLKQRDKRGIVTDEYVLDPTRTRPMVAPNGEVFYALKPDPLSQVPEGIMVPAREIIHDVMVPLFHPLCGISPITACGLAAMQGLRAQGNSIDFFENGSAPGAILTAPGRIDEKLADQLKRDWETEFSGANAGRVAVVGNGLTYQPIPIMSAVDSQFIEQLKWTAETVCTAFRVPGYKVGVGTVPESSNIEALDLQYYSQCLQSLFECIELLTDEGLGLESPLGSEFDIDDLARMDTSSRVKAALDGIGGGGMSPNEARKKFLDLPPTPGGQTPYLQQQNYSLAALDKRDKTTGAPPSMTPGTTPTPPDDEEEDPDAEVEVDDEDDDKDLDVRLGAAVRKELGLVRMTA